MISTNLDVMITDAMKHHQVEKLNVLRLVKTEFTKFEKTGKKLTENDEVNILLKMVAQRVESVKQYNEAKRFDLSDKEAFEIETIKNLLPKLPSQEEIEEYVKQIIQEYSIQKGVDYKLSMRDMKPILTKVQEKYSTANGKTVSDILKKYI